MNKEVEDLIVDILKQLVDKSESTAVRRIGLTMLAKADKIRKSNTLTGKNIDDEMKLKVPIGRECERCPFLGKDWCNFLEVVLFRKSKACTYNL